MSLNQLAKQLLADFDAGKPGGVFESSDLKLDVRDAYDLQFEVAALREARGERVAGYKIGCVSQTMQQQLGISHPVFGHVWDTEVYGSDAKIASDCFDGLAVEGELAVHVGEDIPSGDWLRLHPKVLSDHRLVVELHNYVFRGSAVFRAAELISNNAIHAGVVMADATQSASAFDPHSTLSVTKNGERLGDARITHSDFGLLDVVASVSEHLCLRGQQLKRGQIVLAGSPLPLWRVSPGDRIVVSADGLETASCLVE